MSPLLPLLLLLATTTLATPDPVTLHRILISLGFPSPSPNPCCLPGILCSGHRNRTVTSISLPSLSLSGQLPSSLGNLTSLLTLSLPFNLLSGPIPRNLLRCTRLRVLDLSFNDLHGDPSFLSSLPDLEVLSLAGNPLLTVTSPPLRRSLLSNLTSNSTGGGSHRKSKAVHWVIGFVVGALTGVVTGALFFVLFRLVVGIVRGRFRVPKGPAIFSPLIKKADDLAFLVAEEGIAGCEMIGKGGCGEVYRGTLKSNPEMLIAIKKIVNFRLMDPTVDIGEEESKMLDNRMRQLRSEIQTVGHIRHRNLLPLLAHVPTADYHYLIYEYMKNGSLQDALNGVSQGPGQLTWLTRLRIARGIAAGLEYLHFQHKPRIIHRDLKPANILLDDDLEARIADFGLAKAIPDANTHMTTSNVAGTAGYIAPEYHQMLRFTDKCDIYSFGVILAVLVVGKMPSDVFFQETEEMTMVKWLRNVVAAGDEAALDAAMDKRLLGGGHENQIVLVLKVACFCTVEDPRKRPDSKEARCMLDQIEKVT